jgi:predicted transposase/invertase (TIGR01784 family)
MRHYLPTDVAGLLDVSDIELLKDSFVDTNLREHLSDLLYKVHLKDGQGAYIYVLLEHKSSPDRWIAFQLLRYIVRIWEQCHEQHGALYPILPLVMYHGTDQWRIPLNLHGIVDVPEAFKRFVPEYTYWLCDLSGYSDEQLKGEVLLQLGLLTLKYVSRPDWHEHMSRMARLMHELSQQQTGLEFVEMTLYYLTQAGEHIDMEDLRALAQRGRCNDVDDCREMDAKRSGRRPATRPAKRPATRPAGRLAAGHTPGAADRHRAGAGTQIWTRGPAPAARDDHDRGPGRLARDPGKDQDGQYAGRTAPRVHLVISS